MSTGCQSHPPHTKAPSRRSGHAGGCVLRPVGLALRHRSDAGDRRARAVLLTFIASVSGRTCTATRLSPRSPSAYHGQHEAPDLSIRGLLETAAVVMCDERPTTFLPRPGSLVYRRCSVGHKTRRSSARTVPKDRAELNTPIIPRAAQRPSGAGARALMAGIPGIEPVGLRPYGRCSATKLNAAVMIARARAGARRGHAHQ